jgi:hypothetical protein
MIPHRTWHLDFEKSRQQLGQFRHDLTELNEAEIAFEASLNSSQRTKIGPLLNTLRALWKHLEGDAMSLDSELRKGYPTRWHVARDSSDMQAETRRLQDKVADKLHF